MAEESSRARLTITKVEPQIRVLNTSARSAVRGFRMSDFGFRVVWAVLTGFREATALASTRCASEPGRGLRAETTRWAYALCRQCRRPRSRPPGCRGRAEYWRRWRHSRDASECRGAHRRRAHTSEWTRLPPAGRRAANRSP